MSFDPAILALLAGPIAISVATSDERLRPSLAHVYGCRPDTAPQSLRLFVIRDETEMVLANIAANRRVAAVFSDVRTFRSLQIKGVDARAVTFDAADAIARTTHQHLVAEEIVSLGYAPGPARAYFSAPATADFVTILFTASDIYQQTPGPGAGAKLPRGGHLGSDRTDNAVASS